MLRILLVVAKAENDNIALQNQIIQIKAANDILQKTVVKTQEENSVLAENVAEVKKDNVGLRRYISEINENIRQLKEESVTLTAERDSAKEDIQAIKTSISYKVGRVITYFPRKIRDLLKPKKK